jgi:general stress protein 26
MAIPTEKLDTRYSDGEARAVPWSVALDRLTQAELAWIVTVRPDGRPHATPMVPVVHDGKVYFHTGRNEVKYANLLTNQHVLVLAGDTAWEHGLDVMVQGVAAAVTDATVLRLLADLYRSRWDGRWKLEVTDSRVVSIGAPDVDIVMFEVTPSRARGHAKGDPFGQTTYRFAPEDDNEQEGSR